MLESLICPKETELHILNAVSVLGAMPEALSE
jgi:hypothetical protein